MSDDEVRLQAHLDAHPGDAATRLVLADLLEERGDNESARVQRWLGRLGKWPDNDLRPWRRTGWHWWSRVDEPNARRRHAVLPREVQTYMPPDEWLYATRIEAETILGQALVLAGAV